VTQIKRIRAMIDTAIEENNVKLVELETERDNLLRHKQTRNFRILFFKNKIKKIGDQNVSVLKRKKLI
jgi:hypothetical protein